MRPRHREGGTGKDTVARLSLRFACTALAATLALLAAQVSPAQAGAPEGATWLNQQIGSKGYLEGRNGAPDGTDTAYAVLALYSAGQGSEAKSAVKWLHDHIDDVVTSGGTDNPASLSILIMALRAAGGSVGSLITRLQQTQVTAGPDAGLFGGADPTFDGATRQGLSLLALASVGQKNAPGTDWLVKQQCADGSWQSYRTNITQPCGPTDPTHGTGPDTNSTAMAYQGLKVDAVAPPHDPIAWLATNETPDAGWSFYGGAPGSLDANSTSLVIQAIIASGSDPNALPWARNGSTPLSRLGQFQLPSGAYTFSGGSQTNVAATVQAVPAAASKIFPLPAAATPLVGDSGGSSAPWIVLIVLVVLVACAAGAAVLLRRRRLTPAT